MADWTKSMQQTFEYYIVDPETWKDMERLDNVTSCTINRDREADTLGSATIDITGSLDECYVRVYLITIQNGVREKYPLATVMVQTPSIGFDGKIRKISMDAYTPLLELKEKLPPIGYSIPKQENIMKLAYTLVRENLRAPVVEPNCVTKLVYDFISDTDDKWITFLKDFIANAKYEFDLDEMGRVLFVPKQDTASLTPIWTYNDDNSSILKPEITLDRDLYGIPNVVEVVYSNGTDYFHSRVVNDNPNSPISTVSRGREIVHRVTDAGLIVDQNGTQVDEYAEQLLRDLSSLEYTVTYTHGYCPVRVGDCVRLNYERAGLKNVKARVISQSIKCEPGCPVTEKATFKMDIWKNPEDVEDDGNNSGGSGSDDTGEDEPEKTYCQMRIRGDDFNERIKCLAKRTIGESDRYMDYDDSDEGLIEQLTFSKERNPTSEVIVLEKNTDTGYFLEAWYDAVAKTMYLYSNADYVIFPANSNWMFNELSVKKLDLSRFVMENVTVHCMNMFRCCSSFYYNKTAPCEVKWPTKFDTSNVTDMSGMFHSSRLENYDITKLMDTSSCTNMSYMFTQAYTLMNEEKEYELDLRTFDTSNVTDMSGMFHFVFSYNIYEYPNIKTNLKLGNKFTMKNVTDSSYMFYYTMGTIDLPDNGLITSNKLRNAEYMFYDCFEDKPNNSDIYTVDLGPYFDVSGVTNYTNMFDVDNYCKDKITGKYRYVVEYLVPQEVYNWAVDKQHISDYMTPR